MKYFKIGYGCGCGDNEDYIVASSEEAACDLAYEYVKINGDYRT